MSTDEGPFTVFAPVDEAFDDVNIPDAMLAGMKEFYLTHVWKSSCSIYKQSKIKINSIVPLSNYCENASNLFKYKIAFQGGGWRVGGVLSPGWGVYLVPGGVLSPWGVLSLGGVLSPRGVCSSGGCVLQGVCSSGGCLLGGVCSGGSVCSGGM